MRRLGEGETPPPGHVQVTRALAWHLDALGVIDVVETPEPRRPSRAYFVPGWVVAVGCALTGWSERDPLGSAPVSWEGTLYDRAFVLASANERARAALLSAADLGGPVAARNLLIYGELCAQADEAWNALGAPVIEMRRASCVA